MSSQRRIDSSRANGSKSHGPTTPEGKANSSNNRITHGLTANTVLLRHECPHKFQALIDEYMDEFQPQTASALDLVEELAIIKWRQLRVSGMLAATIDIEIDSQAEEVNRKYETPDHHMREVFAHNKLTEHSHSLRELNRLHYHQHRMYMRIRETLKKESKNFELEPNPKNEQQQEAPILQHDRQTTKGVRH
jgi:hypothetical protein